MCSRQLRSHAGCSGVARMKVMPMTSYNSLIGTPDLSLLSLTPSAHRLRISLPTFTMSPTELILNTERADLPLSVV